MLEMQTGTREVQGSGLVVKISSLICGVDTLQWGLMSRRKYLRQGVRKSRGRTLNAGPGFLFCAPVNGVDYKPSKKRTMANQGGEGTRTIRHDAGDNNKSDVTIQGNVGL